jgi:malonyl-CoA O-methyltransferase
MHELKGLGAHNLTRNRARHLQGKSAWQRMVAAYPADRNGEVWASFEVITGYCRKPVSGK